MRHVERVARAIRRWQDRGLADPGVDPDTMAGALVSMISNFAYWWLAGGDSYDDEAAAATRALVHGALQSFLGDLIRVEAVDVQAEESTLEVTISYRPLLAPADDPRRVLTVSAGTGSAGGGTP